MRNSPDYAYQRMSPHELQFIKHKDLNNNSGVLVNQQKDAVLGQPTGYQYCTMITFRPTLRLKEQGNLS